MRESIVSSNEGRVLTLKINRAEKRNALSRETVDALLAQLELAEADDSVRVLVLTGEGRAFSAGADLAALEHLQDATFEENVADSERLATLFERISLLSKPVIARVNGHAIAGGCGLAAVCDLSVAVDHARFGFTEVRIGFVPAIVSVFVLRKLGEAAVRDLFLRGRLIDAVEARRIGLINEVVGPDELDSHVEDLAQEIARETSGSAVALTKRLLADVPSMNFRDAIDYAVELNARARESDDCRAGVRAFLRKEDPPWRSG